jgi:hypothetical protein
MGTRSGCGYSAVFCLAGALRYPAVRDPNESSGLFSAAVESRVLPLCGTSYAGPVGRNAVPVEPLHRMALRASIDALQSRTVAGDGHPPGHARTPAFQSLATCHLPLLQKHTPAYPALRDRSTRTGVRVVLSAALESRALPLCGTSCAGPAVRQSQIGRLITDH